jgi:molybdate transport system regulatory protein
MRTSKKKIAVTGEVIFSKTDKEFLGSDRIALMEKIDEYGSITRAAKALGISYKTAWDTMNAINNLSEKPLFIRSTGGKSGGGTTLTEEGRQVIRKYRIIQQEHEKFLANLGDKMVDVDISGLYKFLQRSSMKVSARNIFMGRVIKITKGEVKSEVTLALHGGDRINAMITNESVASLGLYEGGYAYAIVKASSVIIGPGQQEIKVGISNKLPGRIVNLTEGAVTTELDVELSGGNMISVVIPNECSRNLELKVGAQVCAMFNAASVILGTD